jgi:serine/threonine-protein kinase RsbT
MMTTEGKVEILSEGDIVAVRKAVREAASDLGFGVTDITRIVTAASELARNVFRFAQTGVMHWQREESLGRFGLCVVFEDDGPGIEDMEEAMTPGFTSGGGLGMGLPGAKRLMDEMNVASVPGKGTRVTIRKWVKSY